MSVKPGLAPDAAVSPCATVQGGRWFCGHWFYKAIDTALAIYGKDIFSALDKRRIFRASEYDNTKGYDTVYNFGVIGR